MQVNRGGWTAYLLRLDAFLFPFLDHPSAKDEYLTLVPGGNAEGPVLRADGGLREYGSHAGEHSTTSREWMNPKARSSSGGEDMYSYDSIEGSHDGEKLVLQPSCCQIANKCQPASSDVH